MPAVAMALPFGGGVAAVFWLPAGWTSPHGVRTAFGVALVMLLSAILLFIVQRLSAALAVTLCAWAALGACACIAARQPAPPNDALQLAQAGRIDLHSPLRWHARLRGEPASMPWGTQYELILTGVEANGQNLAASGGMRLNYSRRPEDEPLPELHLGDSVEVLTEARLPQRFQDEGAFDRRGYLQRKGIELVATLRSSALLERVSTGPPSIGRFLGRARQCLTSEIDSLFSAQPQTAGVLRAMLLGDRSFVDSDIAVNFQKAGVFHVLVIAGLHVGALAVILFWLGRKLQRSPAATAVLAILLLLFYAGVVDQRPPVSRAVIMAAFALASGVFFRRIQLLNSAALAALALLVADPLALGDSSFQLSFLAVACIGAVAVPWLESTVQPYAKALSGWRDATRDAAHVPRAAQFRIDLRSAAALLARRISRCPSRLSSGLLAGGAALCFRAAELVILSLVLQIGLLPLMARDFHRVTLAGPVANSFAVPLTAVIVPLGFATLALGLLVHAAGRLLAAPLGWLAASLIHSVAWFAHLPYVSYRIPGPPPWVALSFAFFALLLAAGLLAAFGGARWLRIAGIIGIAATGVLIATRPFAPKWSPGKLEVSVLDVGQGDSIFVVSPRGNTLLIDGGGAFSGFPGHPEHGASDPGEEAVSPYLWSRGFKRIGVVAVTHAHQDHIGGLQAVFENFRVGALWIGREVSAPALTHLEETARLRHIPTVHESSGAPFPWGGVTSQVLWPGTRQQDDAAAQEHPKNNDSIVLHLKFGERSVLLPGDAEKQAEWQMLAENSPDALRADVLKVAHHGSKNSSMPEFLAAVQPRIAIISDGADNPYGHPSPVLLDRLKEAHARILRTDQQGAVHVLTDGKAIEVRCFVPCPANAEAHASEHMPESTAPQAPDYDQSNEQ
jgi:competence protein ComEC